MTVDSWDEETALKAVRHVFLTARPALFISIIVAAAIGIFAYKLRTDGIFSCQANGYGTDEYLAYCNAEGYADYDHGAFWFNLEPAAREFAKTADVLFLGNSRMQIGFSTPVTADWFSSISAKYFLAGFYLENHIFEQELLAKLKPRAKAYIINTDAFFEKWDSPYAKVVMKDGKARVQYERKRIWQSVHRPICKFLTVACGDEYVVFRSRKTGSWLVDGGSLITRPVSHSKITDETTVRNEASSGRAFVDRLSMNRNCVILTIVPTVETTTSKANAIAETMGLEFIAPELEGLVTFDGSHLDARSAERWSQAFFKAAGPRIRECLAYRALGS